MAFYLLFGLWRFAAPGWRIAAVDVALLFGPRIVAMFPMWLLGVACYHFGSTPISGRPLGWLLIGGSAAAVAGLAIWHYGQGIFTGATGMMDHSPGQIAEDYLVAGLFAVHIIGFAAIARILPGSSGSGRAIRWSAGATFSVYLFHHVILLVLSAWLPWPKNPWTFWPR